MGLVFVLLLGEIDLSAGVAGGVSARLSPRCSSSTTASRWCVAILVGMLVGAVIGLVIGLLVASLGIPSFVVTLAFFLGLQGVPLKLIGEGGSVRVRPRRAPRARDQERRPVTAGWIGAAVVVVVLRAAVAAALPHPGRQATSSTRR